MAISGQCTTAPSRKRALDLKLIKAQGQTPEAKLYAQVLTETNRQKRRGQAPRFMRHGHGFIGLSRWMAIGLALEIEQHNTRANAKRWKQNVQSPIVQQVRDSLGTYEQGLIITTSDFSPGAKSEAERADVIPVALKNGEQLVALLVENGLGVHRTAYDLVERGEAEEK